MWDLSGEVAVVTGAGRGLGRSIAIALAKSGANIAIVYPPFEAYPEETVSEIQQLGVKTIAYKTDVTDGSSVNLMVQKVNEDFERIDILVNNAGKMTEKLLVDMDLDEWEEIIKTDLNSVFLCCRAVVPLMIAKRKGAVINIASQLAYKGGQRLTHYAAAKAGVISLTKSLALEVASFGVRVNAVAPGPLITDMTRPFFVEDGWVKNKERGAALGRLGTPDEVAPTVVFLASPAASLYVGQTLSPNGGGVML